MSSEETSGAADELTIPRGAFFWIYWTLLAALLGGYLWSVRPHMSPNDNSRWDTVWSLVEYGVYEIFDTKDYGDRQQLPTIDKVTKDGKTYSSKPPLLPTVIAWYVRGLQKIVGEPFSKRDKKDPSKGSISIYGKATLFLFQLAPFLIYLILYRRFLDRYARHDMTWMYCLLAAGLGTLVTGYLTTLNNHVIAASFGFFTAYLLIGMWYEERVAWWRFALAGLCVGWTAANELPAGLLAVVATLVTLRVNWKKSLFGFIPALALVAACFFWTNYQALGNFVPAYLQKQLYADSYWTQLTDEKSDASKAADDGEDLRAPPPMSGIDSLNHRAYREPYSIYLAHMTIGHHGLFSLTPIWLFAVWGFWRFLCGGEPRLKGLHWPILFVSAGVFAFFWLVTDQRNYGGFCHGMRWLMWLSPIWMLLAPAGIDRAAPRAWTRWLAWLALAVSIFSAADTFYMPWSRSWLHRILLWFGIVNY